MSETKCIAIAFNLSYEQAMRQVEAGASVRREFWHPKVRYNKSEGLITSHGSQKDYGLTDLDMAAKDWVVLAEGVVDRPPGVSWDEAFVAAVSNGARIRRPSWNSYEFVSLENGILKIQLDTGERVTWNVSEADRNALDWQITPAPPQQRTFDIHDLHEAAAMGYRAGQKGISENDLGIELSEFVARQAIVERMKNANPT